jgi:stage II sporulation protein D
MAAPAIVALLAVALSTPAATWKVRLFWLSPPAEATITREGKPLHLTPASPAAHFAGPLTLGVPGQDPVVIDFPLDVTVAGGRLRFTVTLPREEYVAGVLAGESTVFRSPEALKAMAVTARTYALHFAPRHATEGFDFCDTTHCQDLRLAARSARLRQAVEDTEDEVLWYAGKPAAAYYSRHCGGITESGGQPYLPSHADSWCGNSAWHAVLTDTDLKKAGLTSPVEVLERSPTGRVSRVRAGPRLLTVDAFLGLIGENLGWNRLRSSWFDVMPGGEVNGRGYGHGIGLCQTGAAAQGEADRSYRDILAFYFPGTKVGVNARGFPWTILSGERVELWTTDPGADASLVEASDRALRRAEEAAGFQCPRRVRVRAYPTVAQFRDATGEPGTVAASTAGATVRLQPPALLRARGILDSTLLHEMVHATLETRTRPDIPDWFREGLASALSGGPVPPRIASLLRQYNRTTLIGWLTTGLPASAPGVR